MHTSTCSRRPSLEEVCALIDCGDEGYAGFREGVGVAEERDDGGLAARILALVARGLLWPVLVVIIWIVTDDLARGVGKVNGLAFRFGGGGAERAAGIVEDELATAENGLRVLEAVR